MNLASVHSKMGKSVRSWNAWLIIVCRKGLNAASVKSSPTSLNFWYSMRKWICSYIKDGPVDIVLRGEKKKREKKVFERTVEWCIVC